MKKIINDPNQFVSEMLEGILLAHPNMLSFTGGDKHCIVRADAPIEGKVALATGGGSGHIPVFLGYVGKGLLDGCAVGDVFSSPSADQMYEVAKKINGGKGILYIYGNYGGDVMNFDMAAEMAAMEDIEVRTVLVRDDVASAPPEEADRRRGVAGLVLGYKIAGAKADLGGSLDEVEAVTKKALEHIRSVGVALSPCTVPAAGHPTFSIGDDEMEFGMGIHGEPGMKREKLQIANDIADRMTKTILEDMPLGAKDKVAVMVNSLGATPLEELYILYQKVHEILNGIDVKINRAYIGRFATSMEMAGASLTFFKVDNEMIKLLDHPAKTPFFIQP
jgi:phosphoenolpyruvate---glycerone phosphotransferase subunit DhaK